MAVVDSAFDIAFSVVHDEDTGPTRDQYLTGLVRRTIDLLVNDEWEENLDFFDSFETDRAETSTDLPGAVAELARVVSRRRLDRHPEQWP